MKQDSKSENIARRYQKPYGVSKSHTIGAGIRLRKGKQTVYGYSSDISVPALMSLAKSLSYGFDGSQEKILSQLVEKKFSDLCPRKIPFSRLSRRRGKGCLCCLTLDSGCDRFFNKRGCLY